MENVFGASDYISVMRVEMGWYLRKECRQVLPFLCFVAGKPKKNNALKSLAVLLGPDFITDIIEV